jgi:hypothetical protein
MTISFIPDNTNEDTRLYPVTFLRNSVSHKSTRFARAYEEPPTLHTPPLPGSLYADGAYTDKSLKEPVGTKEARFSKLSSRTRILRKRASGVLSDFCFIESGRITDCIQWITPVRSEVDLENMNVKA